MNETRDFIQDMWIQTISIYETPDLGDFNNTKPSLTHNKWLKAHTLNPDKEMENWIEFVSNTLEMNNNYYFGETQKYSYYQYDSNIKCEYYDENTVKLFR